MRTISITCGLFFAGLGFIGIPVPGLPSTPFFILAVFFFSRSSPRLRHWIENLPRVGPVVRDYHSGAGLSLRVKRSAAIGMVLMLTVSCTLGGLSRPLLLLVLAAGLSGAWFVWCKVPTRKADPAESAKERGTTLSP